jgi:hypothetical protein
MTDEFTLSDADKAQGLWVRLLGHLQSQMHRARERNDAVQDEQTTASLRGEIRCLKRLIALGDSRPMTGND